MIQREGDPKDNRLTLGLDICVNAGYFPPRPQQEGSASGEAFKNTLLCRLAGVKSGISPTTTKKRHNNYRKESSASFPSRARKGAAAAEE